MKYIRTKDGHIFEIEKDLGKYGKSKAVVICDFDGNFIDVEKQNMILNQADTIEELCDEFVLRYKNDKNEYLNDRASIIGFEISKEELDRHDYHIMEQGIKYYAELWCAIWTDKGLIYVAKMNEKGEMELI